MWGVSTLGVRRSGDPFFHKGGGTEEIGKEEGDLEGPRKNLVGDES